MSPEKLLAIMLPFLVGSLLVGVAVLGGYLTASRRGQIERRFVWVAGIALAAGWAGSLALALRAQQWGVALFWAVFGAWQAWRIARKFREARTGNRVPS
jgi:hypothetical protein